MSVALLMALILTSSENMIYAESLNLAGCREASVSISIAAAKINIEGGNDRTLEVNATYPAEIVDFFKTEFDSGDLCAVRIESRLVKGVKLGDLDKLISKGLKADICLPRDIPLTLNITHGLAKANFDLGGINLRELSCEFGAGNTVINFLSPNKGKLDKIEIEHGLSNLVLLNLGNARFKKLTIEHGLSTLHIGLNGKWENDAEIDISSALATIEIVAPKDLGVYIKMEGILSSKDMEGVEKTDDGYRTLNYDKAKHRVTIEIEGALNLVDFRIEGSN